MELEYKIIELSIAEKFLLKCFRKILKEKEERFSWSPGVIFKKLEDMRISCSFLPIPNWNEFEYGQSEISDDTFLNLLLGGYLNQGTLYIITDDSLVQKKAIELESKNLRNFIMSEYKNIYGVQFFGVSDIIIICKDIVKISMIHHEGYYIPLVSLC